MTPDDSDGVMIAEPEPVEHLRKRARRVRSGRVLTGVVAVATVAVIIGAAVVTVGDGSPESRRRLRVAAPSFVLGDIDLVVLSSTFDPDGAREPIPAALAPIVSKVDGVESVSGVIDTFAAVSPEPSSVGPIPPGKQPQPPRSPILFSYHQDDEIHLLAGRRPASPFEIVVDPDFVTRNGSDVGETVSMQAQGQTLPFRIVGTFDLPGVDLTGIPLAATAGAYRAPQLRLDRIDVKLAPGAARANVRDGISIALGDAYTVAEPSIISFPDQRLAQIEIQHAYWALISTDPKERAGAVEGGARPGGDAEYQKHAGEAANAELRVENVTFLSPDAATLTYRIYYGGAPSPIITDPQSGDAARVDGVWRIGSETLCQLASFENIPCAETGKVSVTPPAGWQPSGTLEPEVADGFTTLANRGPDSARAHFSILGWRAQGAATVEVLYVLVTDDGPSTPWPLIAGAERQADGHWHTPSYLSCGITGLVQGACDAGNTPLTRPAATSP